MLTRSQSNNLRLDVIIYKSSQKERSLAFDLPSPAYALVQDAAIFLSTLESKITSFALYFPKDFEADIGKATIICTPYKDGKFLRFKDFVLA